MIPNEMKSWREVMDDLARLTKERDEARAEVERLRSLPPERVTVHKVTQTGEHFCATQCEKRKQLEADCDQWRKDYNLQTHKVITCGVAADHPDPKLTMRDDYMQWNSPQAERVRALRDRADNAEAEVERLRNLYDDAKQSANAWRSVRGISEREHELERQLAEARAEISRMREVESAELRAARDEAIRLGKERDDARAEVERLRAYLHKLGAMLSVNWSGRLDDCVVISAASSALDEIASLRGEVERLRAGEGGWTATFLVDEIRADRDRLRAEVARLHADNDQMIWNLAGISTIACAESLDHYVAGSTWERAALADTARLVQKLQDAKAELARLRASQNERAIAELEKVRNWLSRRETNSGFTAEYRQCADHAGEMVEANIACLRAEQADAPAPVTPPESDEAWLRAPLTDGEIKAVEHATGSKVVTPPSDAPQRPSVVKLDGINYNVDDLRWLADRLASDAEYGDFTLSQFGTVRTAVRLLLDDALAARGGAK